MPVSPHTRAIGFTLYNACRVRASTGCRRAKPALPNLPKASQSIGRQTGVRHTTPYRMPCTPHTPGYAVRAGNMVRGGFFMEEYGRIWENMREYGSPCRLYSPHTPGYAVRAGNIVRGRLMPPNAVGWLHAEYCLHGQSVNRPSAGKARPPKPSQTFPKPLKSSQFIAAAHRCSPYNTIPIYSVKVSFIGNSRRVSKSICAIGRFASRVIA